MTTLPTSPVQIIADIHPKLTHELHRLLSERLKARDRGDWVTKQACDMAIDVLMRLQRNQPAPP